MGLIARAEFPNIKHNIKRECAQKRFFRGLNEYVQEMFYAKVCIKGDVPEKRITLPEPLRNTAYPPAILMWTRAVYEN